MIQRFSLLLVTFFSIAILNGCSGKAQALRTAAGYFEAESLAAVQAIDQMRQREIAPPPRTAAAATSTFVHNVLQSRQPATVERIAFWLDPEAIALSPETTRAWMEFLDDLRLQYTTFAAIFERLEQASFTARDTVPQAIPLVEKLTAQLAYFAQSIMQHPPQFQQQRAALVADLEAIRQRQEPDGDKRQRLSEWREQWLALLAAEAALERATVEQCLKAAILGQAMRQQLLDYNRLSLGDISEAARRALRLAGALTGRDVSHLQARTAQIVTSIDNDPQWKSAAEAALRRIHTALATRSP